MRYDFAHPKFRNGMVTFDEKKPDLLYNKLARKMPHL